MAESDKIEEQRQLYGEPIGDLVATIVTGLGITQTKVAHVLGLSPAMMSQLVSGQRIKIGNPLAVARLQALLDLAHHSAADLGEGALEGRLAQIRTTTTALRSGAAGVSSPDASPVEPIRRVLAAVASRREIEAAAASLRESAPGVAEFLTAYGSPDPARAEEHHAAIAHLIG